MPTHNSDTPTSEAITSLQETIEHLAQQVHVLRQAVDELADELQWRNNQMRDADHFPSQPFVLKNLPVDPTTRNWQVNRPQDQNESLESSPTPSSTPKTLFD